MICCIICRIWKKDLSFQESLKHCIDTITTVSPSVDHEATLLDNGQH